MTSADATLELRDAELAFFRMTCDLFTTPESPLRFVEEAPFEVEDADQVFAALLEKSLVSRSGGTAQPELLERLRTVGECDARVMLRIGTTGSTTRNYYVASAVAVEYQRRGDTHAFGPPRSEAALAVEIAQHFHAQGGELNRELRMSAGDYLAFAVFARDARESPAAEEAMSLEEVLAYFDEPESKTVRAPTDDSWTQSVRSLADKGILVQRGSEWALDPSLHALAREIVADQQHSVTLFDFLDEQWLVREVALYPTRDSVWRLGTEPDGTVILHELGPRALADVLAAVISTLPNLLNPDVPAMLTGAELQRLR